MGACATFFFMSEMRNKANGQFTLSSKFERVCVCGRALGAHDAEAPHGFGDGCLDERDGLPDCERFKHDRKASPEVVKAALAQAWNT